MVFQFQILELLLIFLLVILYYGKYNKVIKKNRGFLSLLFITYLLQIVYTCGCIAVQMGSYYLFFSKLYLSILLVIYSGLVFYYFSFFVQEKYRNHGKQLEKNRQLLKYGFIIGNVTSSFLIFFSNLTVVSNEILYHHHLFMFFVIIYMLLGFVGLFLGRKEISWKRSFHLWVTYFIFVISFVLQGYFGNLAMVNSFVILLVLYMYLTLENLDIQSLEVIELEKMYYEKKSIDKVSFLKNISHEIRTPIHTIDGFSQLILDSDNMKEIKTDVLDIRSASRDLIDVINGMIDLSIIESGKLEIIKENYNVYDMFDGVVDIVYSKLREKEVSFEVEIAKDIPEVLFGDSERISQVILNIIKNSIKYTEKGKIIFRVECVKSNTICRLKIIVQDTGKGMKEEEIQKIFMDQLEKERQGIGLLVSKHLVNLMEGNLEVESTYQEGTTMIVTLDQKIISEKQVERINGKKEVKPFSAKGKRVLVVDDNKLNLKVASKLLMPYDLEVVEVNSGRECLDLLDKDSDFDLILMDDLMPEMSGTETLDILKKIQRVDGYYIPVVVVTANVISGQREKYLEMGFEDYLSKPIERYELDRILKKYLKGRNK